MTGVSRRLLAILCFAVLGAPGLSTSAQEVPAGATIVQEFEVGSGFGELGAVQPDGDDAPIVPLGIAVLPSESIVILDNVNLRIVKVSMDGSRFTIRNTLPPRSRPLDIAVRSAEVYLLDGEDARVLRPGSGSGRSLGSGGRSLGGQRFGNFVGIDDDGEPVALPPERPVSGARSLPAPGDAGQSTPTQFNYKEQFVRTGRGYAVSPAGSGGRSFERPERAADFSVAPTADTHAGVDVVTARIIWKSANARINDVYVEELDTAADGIPIRTAVRRYQRPEGQVRGPMPFVAIAPLAAIRFGRAVVASDGMHAYQLQPVAGARGQIAKFRLLRFQFLPVTAPRPAGPVTAETLAAEPAIPASVHPWPRAGRGPLSAQSEARARRANFCARARDGDGTQAAVLAKIKAAGDAYMDMTWTVNGATMGPSSCNRPGDWKRPPQLALARPGDVVKGMPYGWGNFDTVESFRTKVQERGVRGGSVCTKAQAISNTAGIDCSGFVHRALGLESRDKLSTVTMQSHMIDLQSYGALRPGDVLLEPSRHVMFFLGAVNGGVKTVESTKGCPRNFQGVCEVLRSYTEVGAYRPARAATNCTR